MGRSTILTGIVLYGVFIAVSFGFLYGNLNSQHEDANTINKAGLQRMLSQRIALSVKNKQLALNGHDSGFDSSILSTSIEIMHRNHMDLVYEEQPDDRHLSSALNGLYFAKSPSLYQRVIDYTREAERVLRADRAEDLNRLNLSLFQSPNIDNLLERLDEVVKQYEEEAQAKLQRTENLLNGLIFLHALALLVLYGLCAHALPKQD